MAANYKDRKKSLRATIRGTLSKILKTDIPHKVSGEGGNTVRNKNVVYVSGPSTWKIKAAQERARVNDITNRTKFTNATGNVAPLPRSLEFLLHRPNDNIENKYNPSTLPERSTPHQGHSAQIYNRHQHNVAQTLPNVPAKHKHDKKKKKETYRNYVFINEYDQQDRLHQSVDVLGSNVTSSSLTHINVQDNHTSSHPSFPVDVNNAGEGNMEISITGNNRNIQNHVRQMGPGNFEVQYTPLEGAAHDAVITFNGEHVPGE